MCMPAAIFSHRGNMEILAGEFEATTPMGALKNLEETMRGLGAECALAFADGEDPATVARTFVEATKRVTGRISAFVNASTNSRKTPRD